MKIAENTTLLPTTAAENSFPSIYINLSPLMVLVAVCFVILFCCLCLTSFNSWMKNYQHDGQKPAISYGEAQQDHLKFGSVFMSYMPKWMAERITQVHSRNDHQLFRSRDSSIANEKELLLSLSRVHYNSFKGSRNDDEGSENMDGHSSSGSS